MIDVKKILRTKLKVEILSPFIFLCGEEPYYIDRISEFIEKPYLQKMKKRSTK